MWQAFKLFIYLFSFFLPPVFLCDGLQSHCRSSPTVWKVIWLGIFSFIIPQCGPYFIRMPGKATFHQHMCARPLNREQRVPPARRYKSSTRSLSCTTGIPGKASSASSSPARAPEQQALHCRCVCCKHYNHHVDKRGWSHIHIFH